MQAFCFLKLADNLRIYWRVWRRTVPFGADTVLTLKCDSIGPHEVTFFFSLFFGIKVIQTQSHSCTVITSSTERDELSMSVGHTHIRAPVSDSIKNYSLTFNVRTSPKSPWWTPEQIRSRDHVRQRTRGGSRGFTPGWGTTIRYIASISRYNLNISWSMVRASAANTPPPPPPWTLHRNCFLKLIFSSRMKIRDSPLDEIVLFFVHKFNVMMLRCNLALWRHSRAWKPMSCRVTLFATSPITWWMSPPYPPPIPTQSPPPVEKCNCLSLCFSQTWVLFCHFLSFFDRVQ